MYIDPFRVNELRKHRTPGVNVALAKPGALSDESDSFLMFVPVICFRALLWCKALMSLEVKLVHFPTIYIAKGRGNTTAVPKHRCVIRLVIVFVILEA